MERQNERLERDAARFEQREALEAEVRSIPFSNITLWQTSEGMGDTYDFTSAQTHACMTPSYCSFFWTSSTYHTCGEHLLRLSWYCVTDHAVLQVKDCRLQLLWAQYEAARVVFLELREKLKQGEEGLKEAKAELEAAEAPIGCAWLLSEFKKKFLFEIDHVSASFLRSAAQFPFVPAAERFYHDHALSGG